MSVSRERSLFKAQPSRRSGAYTRGNRRRQQPLRGNLQGKTAGGPVQKLSIPPAGFVDGLRPRSLPCPGVRSFPADSRQTPRRLWPFGAAGPGRGTAGRHRNEPNFRESLPERLCLPRHRTRHESLDYRDGGRALILHRRREDRLVAPPGHRIGREDEHCAGQFSAICEIELIQPRNEAPSMYREFPGAGHVGLQHMSCWTEDYQGP